MAKKQIEDNEELLALRARVAELEAANSSKKSMYHDEIQAIKNSGNVKTNSIQYKDIHDHKNIYLYHTNGLHVGKAVGPLHPTNAETAYGMFYKLGIVLSVRKPTLEEVERYKETDEYKKQRVAFIKDREAKQKSRKESEVEKLTKAISQMSGIHAVNSIMRPEEVGVR